MAKFTNPSIQWGPTRFTVSQTPGVGQFTTIQEALNAAFAAGGGTIDIAPGTYNESINWVKGISVEGEFCGLPSNLASPSVIINGNQTFQDDGYLSFKDIFFNCNAGTLFTVNAAFTYTSTACFNRCYFSAAGLIISASSVAGTSNVQLTQSYLDSSGGNCIQCANGTVLAQLSSFNSAAGDCIVLGANVTVDSEYNYIYSNASYCVNINSATASYEGTNCYYLALLKNCIYFSANGFATSWGENFYCNSVDTFYASTAAAGTLSIGSQTVTGTAVNINPAITIVTYPAGSPTFTSLIDVGQAVFGTNSFDANALVKIQPGIYSHGLTTTSQIQSVDGSSRQASVITETTFQPTAGATTSASYLANSQFAAPPAQTITNASDFQASPYYASNVGTITTYRGFYYDGGSAGAGTITNTYGGYFSNPVAGTNKTALYSDNASVGYTNTAPPANGFIVSGRVLVGTSSGGGQNQVTVSNASFSRGIQVQGTQTAVDGSSHQHADSTTNTFAPTTGATLSTSYNAASTFAAPAAQTIATAVSYYASPVFTGNAGTITNSYGFYFDGGGAGVGTITTAYAAYFTNPTAGTTKIATYTDNLNIGYAGTAPPTNGVIASGRSIFGASSGGTSNQISVSTANQAHAIETLGTQTAVDGSSYQRHFSSASTFAPTNGSTISESFTANSIFAAPLAQTITTAANYRASPLYTGNAGTITTAYGFYFDGGGAGVGTITTAYAAYFANPAAGTNKIALYSDNQSVGYAGVVPPANGKLVKGHAIFGANADVASGQVTVDASTEPRCLQISNTQTAVDGSSNQIHYNSAATFSPTNGSTVSASFSSTDVWNVPNTKTVASAVGFRSSPAYTSSAGTITNSYGFWYDGGGAGSGTITNSYGGYFANPAAGTNKTAVYSDNASIGYAGTAPPTNGLIVSGSTAIGTSSANASALLTLSSTTKGMLPPVMTSAQKNAIGTPATGLQVFDSTIAAPQFYNGANWTYALGGFTSTAVSYNVLVTDYVIGVTDTTAARTITLPSAATVGAGKAFIVKDTTGAVATNANAITINTSSGNIDGSASFLITRNYGFVQLVSNGTNYFIDAQGPIMSAISTASTSFNLMANNFYRTTAGTAITATLPSTCSVGDTFEMTNTGAGLFSFAQQAGQVIRFGTKTTTSGVSGSIAATQTGDSLKIICVVANTTFQVISSIGNFVVT